MSPLTREHLTAVEDRLSTLETAMQKLFPDGQMELTIRSLLTDSQATKLSVDSVAQDASAAAMQQSDTAMGDVLQHDGGLDIPELPDPFLLEENFTMDLNSTSPISHLTASLPSSYSTNEDVPTGDRRSHYIYWFDCWQSSYHRLANRIYRRLLSVDQISAQEMKSPEDMINNWHVNSTRYSLPFNSKQLPEWAILARDRQLLCDQSLRLLAHRPALLRLLDKRCISTSMKRVAEDGGLGERQCRVNALHTAGLRSKSYALFHAVLVPVIHLRVDPSVLDSITWQRDVEETRDILAQLSLSDDALSR
ncbi:hypothetical protein N8T08_003788 [Aspergillus melleus]|uniref:Uncharacterized protein n=1 Tax=Aspergillus melleus TaxID=138277 RepID=A0ACC3B645_9EURO|nr:hypothetical protein N8T08_003788 [Aspergillus melleus]